MTKATLETLLARVAYDHGCWTWQGPLTRGYARVLVNGRKQQLHRVMFEADNGPISDDRQIDHLCRNRACINPIHLEAVTCSENLRRGAVGGDKFNTSKESCLNGHPFSEANTWLWRGKRHCRRCRADREAARRVQ